LKRKLLRLLSINHILVFAKLNFRKPTPSVKPWRHFGPTGDALDPETGADWPSKAWDAFFCTRCCERLLISCSTVNFKKPSSLLVQLTRGRRLCRRCFRATKSNTFFCAVRLLQSRANPYASVSSWARFSFFNLGLKWTAAIPLALSPRLQVQLQLCIRLRGIASCNGLLAQPALGRRLEWFQLGCGSDARPPIEVAARSKT
jgi:hypothetical protein